MNPKSYYLLILLVVVCLWQACSKNNSLKNQTAACEIPDQHCDSASLLVGNKTNDTIFFNKGESGTNVQYYLRVLPGGTTTLKTGGTDVTFNRDCSENGFSGPIQGIQIPSRYFSVRMNRCVKKIFFIKDGSSVDLEIEDKD